jgi:hypothetical protein
MEKHGEREQCRDAELDAPLVHPSEEIHGLVS